MKHLVKKIKFKGGVDANQMLMKKLVRNFAVSGVMETTATKAKALVSTLQILIGKAQKKDTASRAIIASYFPNKKTADAFISTVSSRVGDKTASGSVKAVKLGQRLGDAAPMARVIWTNEAEKKVETVKQKKKEKEEVKKTTQEK